MNIKSLLIGSAASLFAVSGAYAADPVKVVAEPEPAEYVKICDVYGTGYYYIPGTEICLKIGGLIRYQIDFVEGQKGWDKLARIEVGFDAKQETEYGTLAGHILLRGNVDSGAISSNKVFVQEAWIDLAGLQMGMADTLYDGGLNGEADEGGGDLVHYIKYAFDAGSGITATLGLEEEDNGANWVPNVVGKLSVAQGWGGVDLFVAYDDDDGIVGQDDEWAAKGIVTVKASDAITLQAMAIYNSGLSFYSIGNSDLDAVWSVGGSVAFAATDKLTLTLTGQYWKDLFALGEDGDAFKISGVADYQITNNFATKLNIEYTDSDNRADGYWEGFLRFDRTF